MASNAELAARTARTTGRSRTWVELIYRQREVSLVFVLILLVIVMTSVNSRFLELGNIQDILLGSAVLAIVAVAETCVVITRNIDLSVGSMVGLTAYVAGDFLRSHPQTSLVVLFVIGAAAGLGLGMVNAALVTFGRMPAVVATLGTLYAYRGVDFLIAGNLRQVSASDVPQRFADFGYQTWFGIPKLAWVAFGVLVVFSYALRYTRGGRQLYAIGSNTDAARLAGIRVGRHVFAAFSLSGLLCGLAGVLWVAQYASADSQSAQGLEFVVIAAVVVGGVTVLGGSGTVVGAVLGALLLQTISNGLTLLQVSQFWPQAIFGAALLIAVTADAFLNDRVQAALRRRRAL